MNSQTHAEHADNRSWQFTTLRSSRELSAVYPYLVKSITRLRLIHRIGTIILHVGERLEGLNYTSLRSVGRD